MNKFVVVATGNLWQCRRGPRVLASFDSLGEALALAEMEASMYRPSQVAVQYEEGRLEVVSRYGAFH
jgi:hypothetical protein